MVKRQSSKGGRDKRGGGAEDRNAGDEHDGNIRSPQIAVTRAKSHIWTAAEMREAEPDPLPEIPEGAGRGSSTAPTKALGRTGSGQSDAGGAPRAAARDDDEESLAETGGYEYPAPFTRHDVFESNYDHYPFTCVGKLFFKQDGQSYVGSAFSIGNFAVFTAGHCVHMGNGQESGWSTDVVFVPAYKDGDAPFGQWPASYVTARSHWFNNGIPNGLTEDMGGAVLHRLDGKKISERVGWLGFAWNWSRVQHWHAMGYPAGTPFTGRVMVATQASYAYDGTVAGIPPVGIGCDMTGGCSGGPWIQEFGAANNANGLNSYRRVTRPLEMFSPYFDDRAKALKDELVGGTP